MATLTRRIVRLVAVVGTIPAAGIAVGYRIRTMQAEANSSGERRVYKVSDLPIYPPSHSGKTQADQGISNPKNIVEEQISVVRKAVQQFLGQFEDVYDKVKTTADTGIEHSLASLDYIQNNPGDLPRVIFIAVAGMGGIVLGYRGGLFRKLTYGSLAAVTSSAVCYPNKTVEISHSSVGYLQELWKENVGDDLLEKYWPFRKDGENESAPATSLPEQTSDNNPESKTKPAKLKGDIGQSNPADKDLYSTRTS